MPLKAWIRALAIVAFGLLALALAAWAAVYAAGMSRRLGVVALPLLLGAALYLCWVYLPSVGSAPTRGRADAPRIALTFDDGPNGAHTARVLDVLKHHRARATFFCVGEAARAYPELVRRMVEEGHVVGNHTLEHKKLAWCSRAEVRRQLFEAQVALEAAGAPRPTLFRAPHGFKSPHLGAALAEAGLELVAWSHGVWDTDRPGTDVIVERTARCLSPGKILLLHDGTAGADRSQTVAALDRILTECARRGLDPVTLPELLEVAQS